MLRSWIVSWKGYGKNNSKNRPNVAKILFFGKQQQTTTFLPGSLEPKVKTSVEHGAILAIKQIDFMQKLANMLGGSLIQSGFMGRPTDQDNIAYFGSACHEVNSEAYKQFILNWLSSLPGFNC